MTTPPASWSCSSPLAEVVVRSATREGDALVVANIDTDTLVVTLGRCGFHHVSLPQVW